MQTGKDFVIHRTLLSSIKNGRLNPLKELDSEQINCQIEHSSQNRLSIENRNRMESEFKWFSVDQDLKGPDFFSSNTTPKT